jgi:tRNA threonylcarbamoyl adenosine modification protein YeaZ
MISLFIDTSLVNVSISIIKDGKILSIIQKEIPNMHSVYTTKFIKDALDKAGCDANDIDNIMVVNGPGSFTGVRIGVTVAKTYGYLIKKDLTLVSSLKSLAISSNYKDLVMCLIPANKSSYYVGIYDKEYNNIDNLGIEEYYTKGGVTIIEWADFIEDYLPEERLDIKFKIVGENTRVLILKPHGEEYTRICEDIL